MGRVEDGGTTEELEDWDPGTSALPAPGIKQGPGEQAGTGPLSQKCWKPEPDAPSQPGPALWSRGRARTQALAGGSSLQQLDPENTGFIGADTFAGLVHSHELPLDPAKLDMLVALAQSNEQGQVCYQELVDLVSATVGRRQGHDVLARGGGQAAPHCRGACGCGELGEPHRQGCHGEVHGPHSGPCPQISSKRSSSFKRAIANGQRALPRDGLLDEPGLGVYKRFVRYVAYEILPCEVDRRWYFYRHRSCPPPVFMASVTLAQIIVFLCYGARLNKWVLQTYHPEYMKSPLVYHPGHRARAWRFLTYMFMHVGLEQLGFNALLQLMIGVPLEMVHGLLRISLLYLAGVLAGSLTVSITDMRAPVVGGSGGVYALCSAHLANVVMNWAGMRCPYKLLRMVLALVCMSSEVGRAVWLRFSPPLPASGPQPSFMAHLAGAVVGVSMGLTILRSYEERLRDQCGWWVVLLAYGTFLLFAVFWNVFAYDLLGAHIPPPP
ncbi:rhomboid-related protein 1 isoform X1 [Nomascus leucogenys]|uniref:rhomboid-related protein 1 isoform X1 n=1 Tax=Nomascus leucogenys TaxID=61853 RepID=UPI00122D6457|nr:rhomboid-related protein 1 isoform X1 [Nomascus leucogenys]